MGFKTDCRYFRGVVPCRFNRICHRCRQYKPISKKILIIKIASIGDVLRTTPLLYPLKKHYPSSYIVWLANKECLPILKGNKMVDEVLPMDITSILRLQIERYDWVISLDKDIMAASLASSIKAKKKSGYGLDHNGKVFPFNKEAEYGFSLGLSDKLKFRYNKKTYQEIIFETVGFKFKGEEPILNLNDKQYRFKHNFIRNRLDGKQFIIGLNTGCGTVFPYKKWTERGFVELSKKLLKMRNTAVLLLGGREEVERNRRILNRAGRGLIDAGCDNSLEDFIAIIDCCDMVITADTLAMHISIALKKKTICLFGPTCPQEIELYGRGIKIVSSLNCAPCYKHLCEKDGRCMDEIDIDSVYLAIKRLKYNW